MSFIGHIFCPINRILITPLPQACRDARDRLLPSLSIIDSQYATT
ncbi:hypothetical protein [Candidiatus Paracoxiella cheracis]